MGSADIEARNKQLMALEDAVDEVLKALEQIANADRSGDYSNLIKTILKKQPKFWELQKLLLQMQKTKTCSINSIKFPGSELSSVELIVLVVL